MGYKLSKQLNVIETLELDNGKKLKVAANIGRIAHDFNRIYNEMIQLKSKIGNFTHATNPETVELLGTTVLDFFKLTLGEENTDILLEYYEDDYVEMLTHVLPFIQDVFMPEIKKFAEKKRETMKHNYKRKQRKRFNA